MGRNNNGYSQRNRDYGRPQSGYADHNGGVITNGGSSDSSSRGQSNMNHPLKDNIDDPGPGMIADLEKRVAGVQQDFSSAIHKISEKENEKFDLIFAILSELQQRQAHLEDSVRSLKAQYGPGQCMVPNGNGQMQPQQQQFVNGAPNQQYVQQMNGQMGGQMNGNMGGNQQPMGQMIMQPDGSQIMMQQVMQPQQMIIMQPQQPGGMQYAAVPQMMTPQGAIVQQMPPQMAMQFVAQQGNGQMGPVFMNGQNDCQQTGPEDPGSLQAQMNMIQAEPKGAGLWEGNNAANGQPQQEEAQQQPSETSSQEGKLEDPSPAANAGSTTP